MKPTILFVFFFLLIGCQNNTSDLETYERNLHYYLSESFPDLEFEPGREYHIILSTNVGCAYCVRGTQKIFDKNEVENGLFITNVKPPLISDVQNKPHILVDTLNPELLNSLNLPTYEGPLYIQYVDGIKSLEVVDPDNLDSIASFFD